MTYEEEKNAEQAKHKAQTERLRNIVKTIGFYMIERDAITDAKKDGDRSIWQTNLTARNGVIQLFLRADGYDCKNKIHASVYFDNDIYGYRHEAPDSINIALKKTDEKIAQELRTRLLDEAEKKAEEVKTKNDATRHKDATARQNIADIARILRLNVEEGKHLNAYDSGKKANLPYDYDRKIYSTIHEIALSDYCRDEAKIEITGTYEAIKLIAYAIADLQKDGTFIVKTEETEAEIKQ